MCNCSTLAARFTMKPVLKHSDSILHEKRFRHENSSTEDIPKAKDLWALEERLSPNKEHIVIAAPLLQLGWTREPFFISPFCWFRHPEQSQTLLTLVVKAQPPEFAYFIFFSILIFLFLESNFFGKSLVVQWLKRCTAAKTVLTTWGSNPR